MGILYDHSGNRAPETAVRLVTIDDAGAETSQLATTVTDGSGEFRFQVTTDANASVVAVADLPDGPLHGFYAGRNDEIPIHPLSEAIYSLTLDLTSSPAGRSLSDFSAEELRAISEAIFAWDWSSTPFHDSARVKGVARIAVGRKIALASGGTAAARNTQALEGSPITEAVSFATDLNVCAIGEEIHLIESGEFRFDVEADGTICGGTSPTLPPAFFDKAFTLNLPGQVFFTYGGSVFPLPLTPTAFLIDGRTVAPGPYSLVKPSSIEPGPWQEDTLTVARKIYVPQAGDTIRYLEIFRNSGTEDRTIDVTVQAYLTTTNQSKLLTFDTTLGAPTEADRFIATYDDSQNRPTAGFAYQDGLGTHPLTALLAPQLAGGQVNEVRYVWNDVTIPPGSTRTLLHYGYLTTSRLPDDVHATLTGFVEQPDMSGLTRTELAGLLNFTPNRGTVYGEAGAVIGLAEVTARNTRTGERLTVSAHRDGSFALAPDTRSGDAIHLTASDGLDTTLMVP